MKFSSLSIINYNIVKYVCFFLLINPLKYRMAILKFLTVGVDTVGPTCICNKVFVTKNPGGHPSEN